MPGATAGSAGLEDLPVANYHIPLFIYAPGFIPAREVDTLASQIDLAPTLLGLLGISYESTFFGRNLLLQHPLPGRAPIGNYQHLGLFDGHDLAILSPRRGLRQHRDALGGVERPHDEVVEAQAAQVRCVGHVDDLVRMQDGR